MDPGLRVPGLRDPGPRVPGLRDPGPRVSGLRDPVPGTQGGPGNPGGALLLKKSVKRKIRYHVERLPAADNGFLGHDNPPVWAGRPGPPGPPTIFQTKNENENLSIFFVRCGFPTT